MVLTYVHGVSDRAEPRASRDIDAAGVAFRQVLLRRHCGATSFRGSIPSPHVPLSTLRRRPYGRLRMTRGRCGSLILHRMKLSFTTPCRFDRRTGPRRMGRRRAAETLRRPCCEGRCPPKTWRDESDAAGGNFRDRGKCRRHPSEVSEVLSAGRRRHTLDGPSGRSNRDLEIAPTEEGVPSATARSGIDPGGLPQIPLRP